MLFNESCALSRLAAVVSTINDQRNYVVRMPEPIKDLAEWKTLYATDEVSDPANDVAWAEKLAAIAEEAANKARN